MKKEVTYEDAKRFCRLTDLDIEKAKSLKIQPKSLIRCQKSSAKEKWKDDAKNWVRKLYEKEFPKNA